MMNKEACKKDLLEFTVAAVDKFLQEHPGLSFYAFAYDCNLEYAEVNLCFNTEVDFQVTLKRYQEGPYGEAYQAAEDIRDLKYNTGDWCYQCFDGLNVLSKEELNKVFADNSDDDQARESFIESLGDLVCEALLDFTQTKTYVAIPKDPGFVAYSIDHDEDVEDAFARLERVRENYSFS